VTLARVLASQCIPGACSCTNHAKGVWYLTFERRGLQATTLDRQRTARMAPVRCVGRRGPQSRAARECYMQCYTWIAARYFAVVPISWGFGPAGGPEGYSRSWEVKRVALAQPSRPGPLLPAPGRGAAPTRLASMQKPRGEVRRTPKHLKATGNKRLKVMYTRV
jgi:hypothetical protein